MTRLLWLGLLAVSAFLVVGTVQATGDKANGRKLVYTCAGCHGVPGYSNAYPDYPVPKIVGQNEQYLINALNGYKDGSRSYPTMVAQAQSLSQQDIEDIAAYLSSLAPAMPKLSDSEKAALDEHLKQIAASSPAGKAAAPCIACHGADGNAVDPQYPRLAGQYNEYLQQILHEYKDGRRSNPIMKGMVATLSDQDIQGIGAYFSSLPDKDHLPQELDTLKGHIQGD